VILPKKAHSRNTCNWLFLFLIPILIKRLALPLHFSTVFLCCLHLVIATEPQRLRDFQRFQSLRLLKTYIDNFLLWPIESLVDSLLTCRYCIVADLRRLKLVKACNGATEH
jgi:hypothetical protein